MNLFKKSLCLCAFALAATQMSYAVPAYPKPFKVKQADGTYITIQLRGDEYAHLAYTADGYPLVFNDATGNYDYAQVSNGLFVSSGVVARDANMRSVADNAYLQTVDKNSVVEILTKKAQTMRAPLANAAKAAKVNGPRKISMQNIYDCKISDYPTTGTVKALVILINFTDRTFTDGDDAAHALWNNKLNGRNYTEGEATGSVWDFYHQASVGQYDPDFVLVGPVTVAHNVSYYGGNSSGEDSYERIGELVAEAATLAADSIDYSEFDTDSDGKVDNVYFIYAGYGEADSYYSNTIWPHSYEYSYLLSYYPSQLQELVFNGKTVDRYTMSQELNGQTNVPVGIGTFAHEFGHVLGFADHYNTSNSYAEGQLNEWDLMASGSYNNDQNTPPTLSAFERAQLGWLEPTQLSASTDTLINLPCLSDSNFAYAVSIPGNDNEGFLIENRQQKNWDTYLPGHGLLVWHIDLDQDIWMNNTVNNVTSHQRVDIVESDGTAYADSGDPFPGTSNKTQFDFEDWAGDAIFSFADVMEPGTDDMQFLLKTEGFSVGAPDTIIATNILGKSMDVTWNSVNYAKSYTLTVSSVLGDDVYTELTDTTMHLSGLTPETAYTLKVVAILGIYTSDTTSTTVTTLPLQFQERTITALPATNTTTTGFTANWEAVPGTEHYYLTVNERLLNQTTEVTEDFTDRDNDMFPVGWSASTSTYRTSITGENPPALGFTKEKDSLLIEAVGDSLIKSLTFYWSGSRAGNQFVVSYLNSNNVWEQMGDTLTIQKARADSTSTFTFDNVKAVSVVFIKAQNTGYGVLDDVTVTQIAPVDEPMSGYTDVDAGTATSYVVTGLEQNHRYSYTVYAVSGDQSTPVSNLIVVQTLADPTGIESIDSEKGEAPVYFDLNGRRVNIANAPNGVYIVRQGGKTFKVLKK
ncbi:MAG: M6 family metalloprotease domain-containing protein [Prevotella sp.]|jgi:M6 family metalloprotease-like protein